MLYNISVVLQANSLPLFGGDNSEHLTAKNNINTGDGLRDSSDMNQFNSVKWLAWSALLLILEELHQ